MKILIVPDKFKYTLKAREVADAIAASISDNFPNARLVKMPSADGGEGSSEILAPYFQAEKINVLVHNPLFKVIKSHYYYSAINKTALIDLSAASGLELLSEKEQNPLYTSSYGTGELLADALKRGAQHIFISAGGSAVNDAACGAAEAIGYVFFDKHNRQIKKISGKNLMDIARIEKTGLLAKNSLPEITVLYDVSNNLHGKNGAAYVYAPQKGADKYETELLDKGLKHFAKIVEKQFEKNINASPGCGAAGGFGGGSKFFFNARLKPGAETILRITGFYEHIKNADLIITGEGKFDSQSYSAKLSGTLIHEAEKRQVPILLICGMDESDFSTIRRYKNLQIEALYKTFPGIEQAKSESLDRIKEIIKKSMQRYFQ